MKELRYNEKELKELLKNKYVKSCTGKNIIFTKECKLESIELYKSGLTSKEVFQKLGFPEYIIKSRIPVLCLNRWKKKIKKIQTEEVKLIFKKNIDFDNMTLEQENEYLKAKLAYYQEMNKYINSGFP